jgi:glycosyltransferase involved in cell wall biosynthesis
LKMIESALESVREPARKKILAFAYACEPDHGSEPGVGWRMCQAISREHEVWVITRQNNQQAIEQALAERPNAHLHFQYADLPHWARFWKKGERGIRIYYYLWQFAALRVALELQRTVEFDLAHHITFVNDYLFTGLALQPVPFVWGPIGSPDKRPEALWRNPLRLLYERREYYVKVLLRVSDPLFWVTAIRARLVVCINQEIMQRFPTSVLARHKFVYHTAIGVEERLMSEQPHAEHEPGAFHVLSMGRLIRIKGFDLSIRAFAQLARGFPGARMSIVGDGPLRSSLEGLAQELGVCEKIDFIGHLPRADAMALMGRADVFIFPSCEAEGMVVLEALAQGLPVVCLAYGGPGTMVTPECGFAVEVGPQAASALGNALEALASQPALLRAMSDAARRHVREHYLWERRPEAIRRWYQAAGIDAVPSPTRGDAVVQSAQRDHGR